MKSFYLLVDPCASVKCDFYGKCDVIGGNITCVCPGEGSRPGCGNEEEPLCGSDGKIYENLCLLMTASCQQKTEIIPALPESCGTGLFLSFSFQMRFNIG